MFLFWKIWRAFISFNTRFEIRPFTLSPTYCCKGVQASVISRNEKAIFLWLVVNNSPEIKPLSVDVELGVKHFVTCANCKFLFSLIYCSLKWKCNVAQSLQ